MVLVINEAITGDTLNKLAEGFNQAQEKGQVLDIYFSSDGGFVMVADAMIDLINRNNGAVTLTAFSLLESAGFDVFFRAKCPRQIMPNTVGMIHYGNWNATLVGPGKVSKGYDGFKTKVMKEADKKQMEFFRWIGVTEAELQSIEDEEEVWLSASRLEKMLARSQKAVAEELKRNR